MFCIFASLFGEKIKKISKKPVFGCKKCRFDRTRNSFFQILLLEAGERPAKNGRLKIKNKKCKRIISLKGFY